MKLKPRKPPVVHPGELLQELLEQRNISQSALARHLKTSHSYINDICRKRRGVSTEMAIKLGKAFKQSPKFWIDLQTNWDLSHSEDIDVVPIKLSA